MFNRFYYANAGDARVVNALALDIAKSYVHQNGDGFKYLTVAWEHTNSAATDLIWTAEITLDGTNYVDITEAIIQSGNDAMEQHDPTIVVAADATGTFTIPIPAAIACRVTCTATAGVAADKITWRACAHN